MKPGVGEVRVGATGGPDGSPDLVVDADDRINWAAFDPFTVPAGGPWPRGIRYEGNDLGFFELSERRPIEPFFWTPTRAVDVDVRDARICELWLTLRGAPMRIVLPRALNGLVDVSVTGELSLLTIDLAGADECPDLSFYPDTKPFREAEALRLPTFDALAGCPSVDVYVSPLRQPLDCESPTQFSAIRRVSLSGAVANVAALARLRQVETLRLLYCPDLSELPPLATWPNLRTVIASNIDETAGMRLRAEIRALAKAGRAWDMASATELRRRDWIDREYGLPFSQWPARIARAATAAFRAAAATIEASETQVDVERAMSPPSARGVAGPAPVYLAVAEQQVTVTLRRTGPEGERRRRPPALRERARFAHPVLRGRPHQTANLSAVAANSGRVDRGRIEGAAGGEDRERAGVRTPAAKASVASRRTNV